MAVATVITHLVTLSFFSSGDVLRFEVIATTLHAWIVSIHVRTAFVARSAATKAGRESGKDDDNLSRVFFRWRAISIY